jgi:hypothetical protein
MNYKPTLYTKTSDIGMDHSYSIIREVVEWCERTLPPPVINRRRDTQIMVFKCTEEIVYGYFCHKNNWIAINLTYCDNVRTLIRTVIHEYVHTIQNLKEYALLNREVGYDKNPLEIEANEYERKYYKKCWSEIIGYYQDW